MNASVAVENSRFITAVAAQEPKPSSGGNGHATPAAGPNPDRIMQLAWAYAPPLILESALHFRVFDLLDEKPRGTAELSRLSGASERGLRVILNALVGLEFLTRDGDCYRLTPESAAFLVSTKPGYRGAFFHHTVRQLIPRWMQLPEAVRTGQPVFAVNQEKTGQEFFTEFVESLFPLSYPAARMLADHLEVRANGGPASVLDIGAGSGVWGIALAQGRPDVRIHAVDWPGVLEVTRKVAERHGVADRLTTAAGDLLEADFGSGHQVATIGHIFHSEGPARSKQLLRRTYEALAPGGTVAIAEWIPNEERTGPPGALLFAVNMLVHTETGDTFTFGEMADWLQEAGFKNPRLLEVPGPGPLVLATK
jgi:3-hydroxy-5-methyl-1-naphthoate 3-O-methyltransferase